MDNLYVGMEGAVNYADSVGSLQRRRWDVVLIVLTRHRSRFDCIDIFTLIYPILQKEEKKEEKKK